MRYQILTVLIALLLGLIGCGGPQINAQEVVKSSADALDASETFHFQLNVGQGRPAPIDTPLGGISILSAEGDYRRPGQISGSMKAQLSDVPLPISMKVILLEDEAYMTNPLDPSQWQQIESDALGTFSPAEGVSSILRGLQNPQAEGTETIEGVSTYHIVGAVESAAVAPLVGGQTPPGTLQAEVWIGVDDRLPRQLVIVGPLDPAEPQEIRRTLLLSEFGKPVTVERP